MAEPNIGAVTAPTATTIFLYQTGLPLKILSYGKTITGAGNSILVFRKRMQKNCLQINNAPFSLSSGMPAFNDQIGRTIQLPHIPRRIISLVPSQTELLFSLGLDERVMGITTFCVHPTSWFHGKSRIGGTKAIDSARINALHPDLILANKKENDKTQIEAPAGRYPVWVSDIKTFPDALAMIRSVGALTGKETEAGSLANEIDTRFSELVTPQKSTLVAYLIWHRPWMAAGGDTFIHHLLGRCGFNNLLGA